MCRVLNLHLHIFDSFDFLKSQLLVFDFEKQDKDEATQIFLLSYGR